MKDFKDICRKVGSEGVVLLRNEKNTLPLQSENVVSVFGRIQTHYIKSGTGSGGLVNVNYVVNIPDGLRGAGVRMNEELYSIYEEWEKEHPYDSGTGFNEPWCQEEMVLSEDVVKKASEKSDVAIIIIGRNAGEGKDNKKKEGSFLLTETEESMLEKVTSHFEKVIVLLNVGNIIDMKWVEKYQPSAVAYIWQGGQEGGNAVADVLTGNVSPSGKLADTIAYDADDYPSTENFGDDVRNYYCEDIYVGYRYFTTFAKNKILYPFGYGLSYTKFEYEDCSIDKQEKDVIVSLSVKNVGTYTGKEVVQIYGSAPQGKLGKPERVLVSYAKTKALEPGESERITITFSLKELASFDEFGITGHKSCFVLEQGRYKVMVCKDSVTEVYQDSFELEDDIMLEQCTKAMSPVRDFERIRPIVKDGVYEVGTEKVVADPVDVRERMQSQMPKEIAYTGDMGIQLADVKEGKATMEAFVAQFSDEDLCCIAFGEGMNSPKVTGGTGCAFGGITTSLLKKGVPIACGTDGPSGLRMDCGAKATSIPSGTLFACTWNDELLEELYECEGKEMTANNIDALLGPGMNIRRSPLCGRNFEYFSEDPVLSGRMALAQCKGIAKTGNTATIKHFCCNNQEHNRRDVDAVVSERALREIYLRPYEIVVKAGDYCKAIMTSYNPVNGYWSVINYDLNTTILRGEWGYQGFVMSDWWAKTCEEFDRAYGMNGAKGNDYVPVAEAQNDIFMVCVDAMDFEINNLPAALKSGRLNRAVLQRNAMTICRYLMNSQALDRFLSSLKDGSFAALEDMEVGKLLFEEENLQRKQKYMFECAETTSYLLEAEILSGGMELSQNTAIIYSNGEYKASFTVCGANDKAIKVMRKIDLKQGSNNITLTFPEQVLKVEKLRIYELKS